MAVLGIGQAVERRLGIDDGRQQPRSSLARRQARRGHAGRVVGKLICPRGAVRRYGRGGRLPDLTTRDRAGCSAQSGCDPRDWLSELAVAALRVAACGAPRSVRTGAAEPVAEGLGRGVRRHRPMLEFRVHRLQRGDAVLGVRVGREQIVHALAGERD